jgi:hypothetical protein
MALIGRSTGATSNILRVKLLDSSVTTGAGLTGLTSASSGLRISTISDQEATATAYTVAGSTIETITTLGTYAAPTATKCRFKEVDATNHPGVYEIHLADARFSVSGTTQLLVSISGATNLAQCDFVIDQKPAANVSHFGGVALSASGGRPEVNATHINGNSTAAVNLAISAGLMIPGTVDGTGTNSTTQIETTVTSEATANHFVGRAFFFRDGALAYQAAKITAYSFTGGRGRFTVEQMTDTPAGGDAFLII